MLITLYYQMILERKKMGQKNEPNQKQWNIKLRVNYEEESLIKKDAIDYQMGLAEYIKNKLLDRLSPSKISSQQK